MIENAALPPPAQTGELFVPNPQHKSATLDNSLTAAGLAALAEAEIYARKAAAPATLRAYKADWTHYVAWCAETGFVPVPASPKTVGAYLASLGKTHAPTTIRRRLSAIAKCKTTRAAALSIVSPCGRAKRQLALSSFDDHWACV